MKVSTRARYGVRLMLDLGLNSGKGQILLKDIAKRQNISEKYLSQIILPLKSARLVLSFRGPHGGYILAKPPKQITIRQIVELLDGEIALVDCVNNTLNCPRTGDCVARDLWTEISQVLAQKLENITLADLISKSLKKDEEIILYNI